MDVDTLTAKLRSIWAKYDPQREAEREALRTRKEAEDELQALNMKRAKHGLPLVGASHDSLFQGSNLHVHVGERPRTWRDEMHAELLAAVKQWLDG